jgi:capsular polysaccharide transport system permease protein
MQDSYLWRGLTVQARCIHALMIRDLMMRYGRDNIGFLWVILEPMILTVGVMTIWSVLKPPFEHGVPLILLVFTGYMILTMWRHLLNAGVSLFERNAGLLYHRHISLIDTFISRMLLEFAGTTTALVLVGTVLVDTGLIDPPHDLGIIICAWLTMALLSSSLALNFAVLTEYSMAAEKFIAPFQYFMLPLSGTFFMVEWLPSFAQTIIWYNPTVHCYEMFRAGFFGEEVRTHYSIWYPLVWSLGLMCLGIWGMDKVRNNIHFG